MSDTKFTPGPWRWEAGRHDCVVRAGESEKMIARVERYPTADIRNANTRLIVAAPDLYAVLDAIMAEYLECDTMGVGWELMDEAEKALKKARGES